MIRILSEKNNPERGELPMTKEKPNKSQINKINKFRILAGNPAI